MPPAQCPDCWTTLTGATGASQARPGSLSVCVYCGCLMKFMPDYSLERLSKAEFAALPQDIRERLLEAQRAFRAARDSKTHPTKDKAATKALARLLYPRLFPGSK